MRFLLDQGLPHKAARMLRSRGIDAVHVTERGMEKATDAAIIASAVDENRVVATLDSDFHRLLADSSANVPSVIRFRDERLRSEDITRLIDFLQSNCADELQQGAAISVSGLRVRVRKLPLRNSE